MGATTFITVEKGKTATDAFRAARSRAEYMRGHGGYTGTIAEKRDFVCIAFSERDKVAERVKASADIRDEYKKGFVDPMYEGKDRVKKVVALARALIRVDDPRITNKWGPAGCIDAYKDTFVFFGWASE